jgi:hypothetical protein
MPEISNFVCKVGPDVITRGPDVSLSVTHPDPAVNPADYNYAWSVTG